MMKKPLPPLFIAILCLVVFLAAIFEDLPIAANLDFFPVYGQVLGMLKGLPFYQEEQLYAWLAELYPAIKGNEVPPLAQPPWYYASLFFLGFFEVKMAAKVWFGINCALVIISMYLITLPRGALIQLLCIIAAFVFPPTIGHLVVGQFTIPVLTGIALMSWSFRNMHSFGFAAGLFMTTLKPHLGIFPFIVGITLLVGKQSMARDTLFKFAILMFTAFLACYIADSGWVSRYPEALMQVGSRPANVECDTCISLTYSLSNVLGSGNTLKWAVGGIAIVLGLLALTYHSLGASETSGSLLLACSALFALILLPYARNYDAILALPAFYAAWSSRGLIRLSGLLLFAGSFYLTFGHMRGAIDGIFWIIPAGLLGVISISLFKRNEQVNQSESEPA